MPVIKSDCTGTNWANHIETVFVIKNPNNFRNAFQNIKMCSTEQLEKSSYYIEKEYGNQKWVSEIEKVYNEVNKKMKKGGSYENS